MERGYLTQGRKGAKAQLGKPQPKNLNRRKRRKQRGKNFAENAEFSQIALQRVISFFASLRLCAFALKDLSHHSITPSPTPLPPSNIARKSAKFAGGSRPGQTQSNPVKAKTEV
jgi:hypothetical protein